MSKENNLKDFLIDLADGIRAKKGTTEKIDPQNFRSEIESIADVPEWDGSFTKIADLKDTAWQIASGWEAEAGHGRFEVNCTYEGNTYNRLGIGYGWEASLQAPFPFNNFALLYNEGTTEYAKLSSSNAYVLSITGGNDVGSATLQDWLLRYGKLLITFTIGGTTCHAEEGMTWAEWVGTGYADGNFEVRNSDYVSAVGSPSDHYITADGKRVKATEAIVEGKAYIITNSYTE